MSIRKPSIPFNSLTTLRPELIGLAAWLCCDGASEYARDTVLKHAAKCGNIDALKGKYPFDDENDFELAAAALAEGKRLVVLVEPAAVPPPKPIVKSGMSTPRVSLNGYGRADAAGFNGATDPDDIEF